MIARAFWMLRAAYHRHHLAAIHRRNAAHPDARDAFLRMQDAEDRARDAWDDDDAWVMDSAALIALVCAVLAAGGVI